MFEENSTAENVFMKVCNLFPEKDGFECYKFKVGSYNDVVEQQYRLPYDCNTLAVLVINTPSFFETTFRKWLQKQKRKEEDYHDFVERFGCKPIELFFSTKFNFAKEELLPLSCDIIHDYDFTSDGKPKVIMSTCGHVSGAAYFYHPYPEFNSNNCIVNGLKVATAPIRPMGVSLHRKHGGHFAFRAVILFPKIQLPDDFHELKPEKVLHTEQEEREAIQLFNIHWQNGRYRDCGCSGETYSELQAKFYSVPPAERWSLLEDWFSEK